MVGAWWLLHPEVRPYPTLHTRHAPSLLVCAVLDVRVLCVCVSVCLPGCANRYLLFRGRHALKVSTAAPPSNIMFENLGKTATHALGRCARRAATHGSTRCADVAVAGTPKTTLVCRRMATCCVTMLLLTISFAIVLIAKQSNSTFSLTPLSECSTDVTASVFDQYAPLPPALGIAPLHVSPVVRCCAAPGT